MIADARGERPAPMELPPEPRAAPHYFQAMGGLLGSPGDFFSGAVHGPVKGAAVFLAASAVFHTCGMLACLQRSWAVMAVILLANAAATLLVSAGSSWLAIRIIPGGARPFRQVFIIHAYAGGVSMLASWIPGFSLFAELWRWCLAGVGLTRGCGLSWSKSVLAVIASMGLTVLFFWALSILSAGAGGLL